MTKETSTENSPEFQKFLLALTEVQNGTGSTANLFYAAEAARSVEGDKAVEIEIEVAVKEFKSEPAKGKVLAASSSFSWWDSIFQNYVPENLRVRRLPIENMGEFYSYELEIAAPKSSTGAIIPYSTASGERTILTFGAVIQLFVNNEQPEREKLILHTRGFEEGGLTGQLLIDYQLRLIRRVLWGAASCILTDRRLVGVVFDNEVPGVNQNSLEFKSMPGAFVAEGGGTVLAFDVPRANFTDFQVKGIGIGSKKAVVSLEGDTSFYGLASMVDNGAGDLVKARKSQFENAFATFKG